MFCSLLIHNIFIIFALFRFFTRLTFLYVGNFIEMVFYFKIFIATLSNHFPLGATTWLTFLITISKR